VGPYPDDDEGPQDDGNGRPAALTGCNGPRSLGQAAEPNQEQKQAAKSTMEDFTRNIQRKKEKELAALHFGGDDSTGPKQAVAGQKVGRNDPCPCGSGKKYKKCHGA
jgi:preprotein translocase subunit SecA